MPIYLRNSIDAAKGFGLEETTGWILFGGANRQERIREANLLLETLRLCSTPDHIKGTLIRMGRMIVRSLRFPMTDDAVFKLTLSMASWSGMTIWDYAILAGAPAATFEILLQLGFDAFRPRPFPYAPAAFVPLTYESSSLKPLLADYTKFTDTGDMVTSVGVSARGAGTTEEDWMEYDSSSVWSLLRTTAVHAFVTSESDGIRTAAPENIQLAAHAAFNVLVAARSKIDPLAPDAPAAASDIVPPKLTNGDVGHMNEQQLFNWFGGNAEPQPDGWVVPLLSRSDYGLAITILNDPKLRHHDEIRALPNAIVNFCLRDMTRDMRHLGEEKWRGGELERLLRLTAKDAPKFESTQVQQFIHDATELDKAFGEAHHWEFDRAWVPSFGDELVQQQWRTLMAVIDTFHSMDRRESAAAVLPAAATMPLLCGRCGARANYTSGPRGALVCGVACQAELLRKY